MMEFKFDLQMFAADWSTSITVDPQGANNFKTLFVKADGTADGKKQDGTDYVATITLNTALASTDNSTTVGNMKSIEVTGIITGDVTLTDDPTLTITDKKSTPTVWTLGTSGNTLAGSSITLSGGSLKAFTDLVITSTNGISALEASGTITLGGKKATASKVSAKLKPGDVSDFSAGKLVIPSGTTGLALETVDISGVSGTFESKKIGDEKYIDAALSGAKQILKLTGAECPFYVTGTNGADGFQTSADKADTIVGGAGTDSISVVSTATVSIVGGAGKDTIDSTADFKGNNSKISGGDGGDTIDFSLAHNDEVSEVLFNGDADNDNIKVGAKIKNSTVLGGTGNDTLYSANGSNTLTGGAGTDYFNIGATTEGKALISDYKYGEDYIYLSAGAVDNANTWANIAVADAQKLSSDGTYGVIGDDGTNGTATISSSAGFFAVNLIDGNKNKLDLGWVGDSGSTVNGSSRNVSLVLTGRTNTEGDLLIGGSKSDTIYAGGGDSIYGGTGKDTLDIDAAATGVYVGIATDSGADAVTGFKTGFDIDTADSVYLVNGTSSNFGATYDGNDLVLSHGGAKMTLSSAAQGGAGTDTTDLLVSGQKVVVAKNNAEITTDDLTYANYWIGTYNSEDKTGSAANLSAVTDAVNVNLGDTEHIRYIYTVTGGSGNTTLMGGNNAERLVAASGSSTSLYGGAGKDTLVSSADTKTEFFFMNGAGNDEIVDFTTGTDTDASDVLNFYGSALGSVSRTDANVVKVKTSDGSTLSVNQKTSSADEKLQWVSGEAKGVAKIANTSGSSLSYETDVTNYFGSSKKDTLAVNAGDGTDVNIWLDGSQGVSYSDIDVVDASGRAANTTIAGSAIAETITGGSGNSSVWGGAGQVADVLRSTSGSTTTFFYGLGNGSDNISGSANDTVNLFDIKLSDIASANIQNSQVIFTTSSKDTVTVSGAQTFQLADGSRWTANYSNNQWESAQ